MNLSFWRGNAEIKGKRIVTIKSYEERAFDLIYETRIIVISKLWAE
jgi:hypothetical protein